MNLGQEVGSLPLLCLCFFLVFLGPFDGCCFNLASALIFLSRFDFNMVKASRTRIFFCEATYVSQGHL